MTTVRYEASVHRLRVEGECRRSDLSTVRKAFETFSEMADGHLIVDLTAVTGIDQSVADELVGAGRRSRRDGGTVAFVRKHGTPVDEALTSAEHTARTEDQRRARDDGPRSRR